MRISHIYPLAAVSVLVAGCGDDGPSNVPPTAAFAVQCEPLQCTFTNSSTDADGTIDGYHWDFGDGTPVATTRDASHQYLEAGQFTATLSVTDDDGETATATAPVDVNGPGTRPSARFAYSCRYLTCEFTDESFSGTPGVSVGWRHWDFGDDSDPAAAQDPTHTYAGSGQYSVRLTVHNSDGASATLTKLVDLSDPNLPPTATFGYSCTDLTCAFTDQSADGDGSVVSYRWDFGDGAVSSERNPEHTFELESSYDVTLTVTDDRGLTTPVVVRITLPLPVFDFTASCTKGECTFTSLSPMDWWIWWEWDFGDGKKSTGWNPTHVYDVTQPTTFTVTLSAMDQFLDGGTVSHDIVVTP